MFVFQINTKCSPSQAVVAIKLNTQKEFHSPALLFYVKRYFKKMHTFQGLPHIILQPQSVVVLPLTCMSFSVKAIP